MSIIGLLEKRENLWYVIRLPSPGPPNIGQPTSWIFSCLQILLPKNIFYSQICRKAPPFLLRDQILGNHHRYSFNSEHYTLYIDNFLWCCWSSKLDFKWQQLCLSCIDLVTSRSICIASKENEMLSYNPQLRNSLLAPGPAGLQHHRGPNIGETSPRLQRLWQTTLFWMEKHLDGTEVFFTINKWI